MIEQLKHTIFPVKEVNIPNPHKDSKTKRYGLKGGKSGYKLLIREDTNEVISCMTNDYQKLDNKKLIKSALPILKSNGAILKEAEVFNNARTIWIFKFPDITVDIGYEDKINPEIIIRNSYDGSTQAMVQAGAFRLVCSNGMVIGVTLAKKKNRHIIWNSGLANMKELLKDTIAGTVNVFNNEFPILYNTPFQEIDMIKLFDLFPADINQIATDKIIADKPKTYWDLMNVATWITTHALNRNQETTHKIEQQIYPTFLKLAKRASA